MNAIPSPARTASRIDWVDVAKAVGITLVFYGHLVEHFIRWNVPAAADHMKWVYSFHIPVFFVLLGFIYKERDISFGAFLIRQIRTRLVPAWAFNIVCMLAWIRSEFLQPDFGYIGDHGWLALLRYCATETLPMFVLGEARWNIVTWFLFCLFTVELWQFFLRPLLRNNTRLVVSIVGFAVLAVLVDSYAHPIHKLLGAKRHWWYITSGVGAMVFYQLGILMRRLGWLVSRQGRLRCAVLGALCLAITLATFDLNQAVGDNELNRALGHNAMPVAFLVSAKYGELWWFALASLAGSFFVIYVSQVLSGSRVLKYIGQITLALMCLDGVFHGEVNPYFAKWIVHVLPGLNAWLFTGICVLATALSIAICIPIILILDKYLPFVLGRRAPRPATTAGAGKA
ncbi:MAG TPA: acyltransferase family protein [Phycisphaerae bacterium]|nr:acyltransferase family protein [Phycisphaerae bacterium]